MKQTEIVQTIVTCMRSYRHYKIELFCFPKIYIYGLSLSAVNQRKIRL